MPKNSAVWYAKDVTGEWYATDAAPARVAKAHKKLARTSSGTIHPQASIPINGKLIQVDQSICVLISTMNGIRGVTTRFSCQEDNAGGGYVSFVSSEEVRAELYAYLAAEVARAMPCWFSELCLGSTTAKLLDGGRERIGIIRWHPRDYQKLLGTVMDYMFEQKHGSLEANG